MAPDLELLLAFEREWLNRPQHTGGKLVAMRARFGLSETRYYQLLNRAIETAEAAELDPVTVRVLRERRRSRSMRRWVTTSA